MFYLQGSPGVQRSARSIISIHDRSLASFRPEGRDRVLSIPGPSGDGDGIRKLNSAIRCNKSLVLVTWTLFEFGQFEFAPQVSNRKLGCARMCYSNNSNMFPVKLLRSIKTFQARGL